jgi:hypothetical protein
MAKSFEVQITKYRIDEESLSTAADAIDAWLDALNIGTNNTVYAINTFKHQGFLYVVAIYEP